MMGQKQCNKLAMTDMACPHFSQR